MDKIKGIKFNLENCEVIEVCSCDILKLDINDVQTNLSIGRDNSLRTIYECNNALIILRKEGSILNKPFGLDSPESIYDRLSRGDLVSLIIETNTGDTKEIYLKYDDTEEYCINQYQKSHINKEGDLFILVSIDKRLEDIFCLDDLDSSAYMQYHYSK